MEDEMKSFIAYLTQRISDSSVFELVVEMYLFVRP
jgi:hypothetical protein